MIEPRSLRTKCRGASPSCSLQQHVGSSADAPARPLASHEACTCQKEFGPSRCVDTSSFFREQNSAEPRRGWQRRGTFQRWTPRRQRPLDDVGEASWTADLPTVTATRGRSAGSHAEPPGLRLQTTKARRRLEPMAAGLLTALQNHPTTAAAATTAKPIHRPAAGDAARQSRTPSHQQHPTPTLPQPTIARHSPAPLAPADGHRGRLGQHVVTGGFVASASEPLERRCADGSLERRRRLGRIADGTVATAPPASVSGR